MAPAREAWRCIPLNPNSLAEVAPRAIDTAARHELLKAIRTLPIATIANSAGLSYALGYGLLIEGDDDSGIEWLIRARTAVRDDQLLRARIDFEIGAMYLRRGSASPADVLLLQARGEERTASGDWLHLQALADEALGDYQRAILNYRKLLQGDIPVLSPATRVLAMVNLAGAFNQRDPAEAIALSELALAMISAEGLDGRLRPAVLNIKGYAQICLGRLADARPTLTQAGAEARAFGYTRVELYSEFNLAIIDELSGMPADAAQRLLRLQDRAANTHPDLVGWTWIRLAWLRSMRTEADSAIANLPDGNPTLRSARYADAVRCLAALDAARRGQAAQAITGLATCVDSATARGDSISAFALLLQLAHVERSAGRALPAQRHIRRALVILEQSSFRLSPNWWSADAFETFVALAPRASTHALVAPVPVAPSPKACHDVRIRRDGTLRIDGVEFCPNWSMGRTGSRMLLRFFAELLARHPHPVSRDVLADGLWPESNGDAAIRNLYAATNDLRKILADIPGVRMQVEAGGYRLVLDTNVRLLESGSPVSN